MCPTLLFDFDGTIADTFELSLTIGRSVLDSVKLHHFTEENIIQFRNLPFKESVRRLRIPLRKIPALVLRIRRGIREHSDEIMPFPGIRDALADLRARCSFLGIITSNSRENVATFLKKFGMDFFNAGAYSSALSDKTSKIRRLMRKNDLEKESVIYIGDTTSDIDDCRKVGIRAAAVTWGYNSKAALEAAKPDFLVETTEDLKRLTLYNR
jgi:phosphoglycolate phosphatase